MKQLLRSDTSRFSALLTGAILLVVAFAVIVVGHAHAVQTPSHKGSLITIHDRGISRAIVTNDTTIGDALRDAGVTLAKQDVVEPATGQKIVAADYQVNIYRARPVLVVDGDTREKVMTAYQTANQIAQSVGVALYPEDKTVITRNDNIVASGAGLRMDIIRAKPFQFDLYGSITTARTQATTVGAMLKEKGIKLGSSDRVSPAASTSLTAGISVRVWREGQQTITVPEPVAFQTTTIQDTNQPIGYRQVQTPGQNGTQNVTYQVDIVNGQEISRTQIASIVTQPAVQQVVVVGVKSTGGLTKSKGVDSYTDANGVVHRETYYDLDMHVVAENCGNGGVYTIRADGVKVDRNGYILIAANLARYPRCSVVQTSLGAAMVYDTGGFISVHPDGYDIATDWTDYNGI